MRKLADPRALAIHGAFLAVFLAAPLARADEPGPPATRPETRPEGEASLADIERLVEKLGADSYAEREAATERLTAIGRPAHDALRRALASPDAEVRYRARLVLRAPLRRVALLLQEVGRRNAERGGEEGAFKTLVGMGEEAIEPLVLLVRRDLAEYQPGDEERLRTAFQALHEIGARAAPPAREERARAVREALLSFLDLNLHNFEAPIAAALRQSGEHGEEEGRAALALRLQAPGVVARRNAIRILGVLGGPATVKAVAAALADPEPAVRLAAVDALVEATRGSADAATAAATREVAAQAIVTRLADPDRQVETRAIEALGEVRAKSAVPELRKIVAAAGETVTFEDDRLAAAIVTLGVLEDRASIPALIPFLSSPRPELVARAADALGVMRARDAVPALVAVLERGQPAALVKVLRALGRIGDERAFEPLKAFYVQRNVYRQPTLVAIARLEGPRPIAFLIERAKASDDEFEVRLALEAVSRRSGSTPEGRAQVGEAALAALARQPVDVRLFALRLIERARYAPAYDAVARLLSSNDSRLAVQAVETISALGDKRAIEPLRGLQSATDEEVRRAAIVAMAKLGEAAPLAKAIADEQAVVARAPESVSERFQLGLYYLYAKDNARGAAEFEEILRQKPTHSIAAYNLACAKSLLGEKAVAVEALRHSIELGFRDWRHMEQDDDLDNIRAMPEMKEIMERLRKEEPGSDMPRLAIGGPYLRELDELNSLEALDGEGDGQ